MVKYGVHFNKYENEIYIYKIFPDQSRSKILKLYEQNEFIHLDIRANNFRDFNVFDAEVSLTEMNMIGVNMVILYQDLIVAGLEAVCE